EEDKGNIELPLSALEVDLVLNDSTTQKPVRSFCVNIDLGVIEDEQERWTEKISTSQVQAGASFVFASRPEMYVADEGEQPEYEQTTAGEVLVQSGPIVSAP
ncbi:unnamed protein product, partial [Amoebophrya sp. A25]